MKNARLALVSALVLALPLASNAEPQSDASTDLSALSAVPVAVSVAAPFAIASGAAVLTVVSVTAVAGGTVWVLERASDGARMSVQFTGNVVVASGTVCALTVIASGTVISAAGRAVAFIPNEVGKSLLYNERVTR
ncbi:hypothetical protein ACFJGW_05905 [Burkholderiaceae bacterium UC74_6]